MKKTILILMLFATSVIAEYDEGIEYIEISKPVATQTGDKIEVRELFWYFCPHCYNLEPALNEWLNSLDGDNVEFVKQPAVFSERWEDGAKFYHVLKQIGRLDEMHGHLFREIHDTKSIRDKEDFVDWLVENGEDKREINKVLKSFTTAVKVMRNKISSFKYEVEGVPAIVVNGKYLTSISHANGNPAEVFKIVNYLIGLEMRGK